jgi:hypothetical protein
MKTLQFDGHYMNPRQQRHLNEFQRLCAQKASGNYCRWKNYVLTLQQNPTAPTLFGTNEEGQVREPSFALNEASEIAFAQQERSDVIDGQHIVTLREGRLFHGHQKNKS